MGSGAETISKREAQEAIRQAERNFEDFLESMPLPAVIHGDKRFTLVNRAFVELLGYAREELVGRSVFDVVQAADRPYVAERLALPPQERAGSVTREHILLHKDGTRIPVEVTSVPVVYRGALSPMGLVRDLRERKLLEQQLVIADRMAALGQLAASVGHEINNPLAYVIASLSLIEREVPGLEAESAKKARLLELVGNVRDGAERVRAIVLDLKTLSRDEADANGSVELARVLDLCVSMADYEIRHRARLVADYAGAPAVHGREARLGQVFLNLLINAAQAIPEGDPSHNEIRVAARREGDDRVAVEVIDTGCGIPRELRARVFEPFFTTKGGTGTGLGLSISHHIVTSLGGTIGVFPNEPRGTRFRVVLRTAATPIEPSRAAGGEAMAGRSVESSGVRVLVVDDEPQLARLMATLLHPRKVTIAVGGADALERLGNETFDVVLCDLHMNDVSGMDVYERVRERAPGLARRMVFMTGGAVTERARAFVRTSGCVVLDKPIETRTLEAALEEAMRRA